ncbi:MAG: aspartate-semialdehyde dehydrogenase [Candidatus Desulforudis sp.]|nr:aspartate-semialdehyde dehydrogenase [Desulforudis sp.]
MVGYNVCVVGATGVVGQEILKVLDQRGFPVARLRLCATARSAGKKVLFKGEELTVEETRAVSFEGMNIALFAGGAASTEHADAARKVGAVVIDNSSAFRLDPEIPLVVPEVNPEDVRWHKGIIANPNCSTIIMVVPLKPLVDAAGVKRVVVSTYQATSGAGAAGMRELLDQTRSVLNGEPFTPGAFVHQIAFNLIPHIDVFQDLDYTKEEWKMVHESRKMFHDESMRITATAVRVPVVRSHAESINLETERPLSPAEAREILNQAPGVVVVDDPANKRYPMPVDVTDRDEVFVGRIRRDNTLDNGLNLFVAADQLRKGAATNAVQIAELLVLDNLL